MILKTNIMFSKIYLHNNIFLKNIFIKKINKYLKRPCHTIDNNINTTILTEIRNTLKFVNIPVLDGYACIIANISLCEDIKEKDCKLYINKITGSEIYI
jgi:hypothetical protein